MKAYFSLSKKHLLLSLLFLASFFSPVNLQAQIIFTSLAPTSAVTGTDHSQVLSRREVVDLLLNQALVAFKSPSRISHAGFTAKMPSHLESVSSHLLKAYELEPYRTDFLISAANAQVYNQNIEYALKLFNQAHFVAPQDVDINSYLAVWNHFLGEYQASEHYLNQIAQLHKGRYEDLQKLFNLIDRVLKTPLKEQGSVPSNKKHAIITLGYALNPDGSMHEILINRLEKTRLLANKNPQALLILTGGVPKNRQTEGSLMAQWLIEKGILPTRIIEENYATSTVDNALFSAYVLARHGVEHASIISSASHVRRGQTLFEIATWQTGPKDITFDTVAYPDKPLKDLEQPSQSELLGIYRDALRTYGMWSYRSYPLQFR